MTDWGAVGRSLPIGSQVQAWVGSASTAFSPMPFRTATFGALGASLSGSLHSHHDRQGAWLKQPGTFDPFPMRFNSWGNYGRSLVLFTGKSPLKVKDTTGYFVEAAPSFFAGG